MVKTHSAITADFIGQECCTTSSDLCRYMCCSHTLSIYNLWYIPLPQSCPGALGSVMCILANEVGAVCGCTTELMCPFMTNLTFWSLPGCSVSPMPDAIQPNRGRNSHGRQSALKHITDHILMSHCLFPQVTEPLELVGMDFVGKPTLTGGGNQCHG